MTSLDDAVRTLRSDPDKSGLVADTYLDKDVLEAAERFFRSGEFAEVLRTVGERARGDVVDLGAGRGIASYSFARAGARSVYAIEPDPSEEVGRGGISRISSNLPVCVMAGTGEALPLKDSSCDLVYIRQVLHHVPNLHRLLAECHRVLRQGGMLVATREHVVDSQRQLNRFLTNHPIHALVGGEHAYPLEQYLAAIRSSGLVLHQTWGPWDSVINAFPAVQTPKELREYPATMLRRRLGRLGGLVAGWGWSKTLVWRYLNRPTPGRLYSFVATKP